MTGVKWRAKLPGMRLPARRGQTDDSFDSDAWDDATAAREDALDEEDYRDEQPTECAGSAGGFVHYRRRSEMTHRWSIATRISMMVPPNCIAWTCSGCGLTRVTAWDDSIPEQGVCRGEP